MAMLRMILGNGDAVYRSQAIERFMARLEADEFPEMVEFLFQQRPKTTAEGQALASAQQMMLSAWTKRDPMGAAQAVMDPKRLPYSEVMDRDSQLQTIASVWGAQDPDAAIAWAKAREGYPATEDLPDPFMVGLIRSVASHDLTKATALLAEMPFGMNRRTALTSMLPQLITKGKDAAAEWIDGLQDEKLKKGANNMVAEELAETSPQAAAEWILSRMGGDTEFSSIDAVMERWMRQQKEEALVFFEKMPAGKVRNDALQTITRRLSGDPSEEHADWIVGHLGQEPMSTNAATWIFKYWIQKDQSAAITHFEAMREDNARIASSSILGHLAQQDVRTAANFYKSHLDRMSHMSGVAVFSRLESADATAFLEDIERAVGGPQGHSYDTALEAWAKAKPEDAKAYCAERGLTVPNYTRPIYMKASAAAERE
ncbi:hypothetical protein [Haloferula sp. BvORR071]|uniref:hypothetical protein n=1 Tax=Haloferula sp. BvORR071 TaxID=1396141 RepID=UPI000556990B|nr:hypothetical protein [Haloferula sp. BvORR071]